MPYIPHPKNRRLRHYLITKDITGRNVLLVDDSAATGSSLIVAKEHAMEKGAKEVKTLCMYSRGNNVVDYFERDQLAVYFPWGKDA